MTHLGMSFGMHTAEGSLGYVKANRDGDAETAREGQAAGRPPDCCWAERCVGHELVHDQRATGSTFCVRADTGQSANRL